MAADNARNKKDLDTTDDTEMIEVDEDAVYVDSLNATFSAIASAEADELRANGSAIGSAHTGSLISTASAIGLATVEGDAQITVSAVPILRTAGGATFSQAYASAVIVGGDMEIHQAAAPVIIGKGINASQVGACAMVTGEAEVTHSTIGLLLARSTNVSEDSRILLSTRGALIIAAALLGGFGLVAVAVIMSAQRVAEWRPNISLPNMPWRKS